jgi:hypothetical protein
VKHLAEVFKESFSDFLKRERDNILDDVAERSLCARWSIYMQEAAVRHGLEGYFADADYNRKQGGRVKTIIDDQLRVIVIVCDLILHSRGKNVANDNLIAVEMKKAERPKAEKDADRERLRAMTKPSYDDIWSYDGVTLPEHVCRYHVGYFVEIDSRRKRYVVEIYQKGSQIHSFAGDL